MKVKIRRLTSAQKQDERCNDYARWDYYKHAHKAATMLSSEQLKIEGGMSVREVEKNIKSHFRGVGPSKETIHHHVINLKSVGKSPKKRGPEGNIPSHVYKALCIAFATKIRICQLNAKVSTRDKQILWISKTLKCTREASSSTWKRIAADTAIDMVAGKVKQAEERRVK